MVKLNNKAGSMRINIEKDEGKMSRKSDVVFQLESTSYTSQDLKTKIASS